MGGGAPRPCGSRAVVAGPNERWAMDFTHNGLAMTQAAATGEVVVTQRGTPVARVMPPVPADAPNVGWGAGADLAITYHGDIVTPLDDEWEMDERNLFAEPAHTEVDAGRG